jgi:molybdopterin synthase catalytic subunit
MKDVRLLDRPFDPNHEVDSLVRACPDAGGIASFVGKVRPTGGVEALELSHYAPLTQAGMEALADEALSRWDLMGLLMVHRVGVLMPGAPIVLVSAASRHRRAAIEAVDFAMDHLKSDAWFWKREKRVDGWHWIEPRAEDHLDLARWPKKDEFSK